MIRSEQKEFKRDFRDIKLENIEESLTVGYHILVNMIETGLFKENYTLLKKFLESIREEHLILNFLRGNLKIIDSDALNEYLDKLDDANTEMVQYIYDFLDDNDERNFEFLPGKIDYRKEAYALTLTEKEIKKFLNFPKDFWNYVSKRITEVDDPTFYGVHYKMNNDEIVEDIKILVPEITNLQTAKVYIHEMKHAFDLYSMLGQEYINEDYEESARDLEKDFENKYLVKKIGR